MSEQQFDKIEAYLEGRLSTEERSLFERQLETDAGLRDLVQEQRALASGIRKAGRLDFQRKMDGWHSEMESPSNGPRVSTPRQNWLKWALLMAVVAVVGILFWMKKPAGTKTSVETPIEKPEPADEERPVASGRPVFIEKLPLVGTTDSVELIVFRKDTGVGKYLFEQHNLTLWGEPAIDLKALDFSMEKKSGQIFLRTSAYVYPIDPSDTLMILVRIPIQQ